MRRKQIKINKAIMITKIKLEGISKPSQVAKSVMGFGKIATMMNAIGRSSQATELLMDIEFLFRQIIIKINRMMAATVISIRKLVIFSPEV